MSRKPVLMVAALSLAFFSSRCGSPVSPEGSAGIYVLDEINGDPLPAVSTAHEFGVTEILADTLWFETNGTGMRHVTYRSTGTGAESQTYRSEDPFSYALSSERIEIAFECRDVIIHQGSVGMASCVAPPHFVGTIEHDGLRGEDLHENRMRYRHL
jgi:hypothetical protein